MKYAIVIFLVAIAGCTVITIQSSVGKPESGQENVNGVKFEPKIDNDNVTTRESKEK